MNIFPTSAEKLKGFARRFSGMPDIDAVEAKIGPGGAESGPGWSKSTPGETNPGGWMAGEPARAWLG